MTLNKFLIILRYTWRTVKAKDPMAQQERWSEARDNTSPEETGCRLLAKSRLLRN